MHIVTSYCAGDSLDDIQKNAQDLIITNKDSQTSLLLDVGTSLLLYHQARVLKGGLLALDDKPPNNIPTEIETLQQFSTNPDFFSANNNSLPLFLSANKIHQLVRAYLFRQLHDISLDIADMNNHQLRPLFMFGLFFEGLASFLLARQTSDSERSRWIDKGDKVLTKMKYWSEHSSWNWESKVILLEAEKTYTAGTSEQAASLYERAIRLAHEHKFIHDEAIASELAGVFFSERGLRMKAEALLLHSIQCYKTWGAIAVAKRVETFLAAKYGSILSTLDERINMMRSIFSFNSVSSKKRQEVG